MTDDNDGGALSSSEDDERGYDLLRQVREEMERESKEKGYERNPLDGYQLNVHSTSHYAQHRDLVHEGIQAHVVVVAEAKCKVLDGEDLAYMHVSKRMFYTLIILTMMVCHLATAYVAEDLICPVRKQVLAGEPIDHLFLILDPTLDSHDNDNATGRVPYVFYTLLAWYATYYGIRPRFEGLVIGERYQRLVSIRVLWAYCFLHLAYIFSYYHMFLPAIGIITLLFFLTPVTDI